MTLFQGEAKRKPIAMEIIFERFASKTHFHKKGFQLHLYLFWK